MGVRLVDGGWSSELSDALAADSSSVRIASPFVKEGAVAQLFENAAPATIQLVTRFNLDHFSEGVSDIAALRRLLKLGARIRGVKRLHAKLYLFGSARAVVTSANLTQAGLLKNHEIGIVAEGPGLASRCGGYFDHLWERAGADLVEAQLDDWEEQVVAAQVVAGPIQRTGLGDNGVDLAVGGELQLPSWFDEPRRGFVKFFGEGHNRAPRGQTVMDELHRGGSHWACTYPSGRRPRAPEDGDLMFMGRLVHSPDDTMIYGRAVAVQYEEGRDDASPEDIARRPWKEKWPHYVRVHHGEYLAGAVGGGVSLRELMDELGPYAFGPTAENADRGQGNEDPRKSIRQAAAIRLAPAGLSWLNEQLEHAFLRSGKLSSAELSSLDWPSLDLRSGH
jgi:hypothetical protein